MNEILYFGLLAFSIVFSIGIAITIVVWVSIGLTNLVDNMEKRARERRSRKYRQLLRGIKK